MNTYRGIPGSRGIAVGPVWVLQTTPMDVDASPVAEEHVAAEQTRFREALCKAKKTLSLLAAKMEKQLGAKEAEIFSAQQMMLDDPEIVDAILAGIASEKISAAAAVRKVINSTAEIMDAAQDEYLRARAADIRDVGRHLLENLTPGTRKVSPPAGSKFIYIGHDITPSETAGLESENCLGFVSELGSQTSHAVILARSMGIPAVVGASGLLETLQNGETVIVNGDEGLVFTQPTPEALTDAKRHGGQSQGLRKQLLEASTAPAVTTDGLKIEVEGNIGKAEEAARVLESGGDGIGLFRSEFFYMNRSDFPSEEEQFIAYRAVAQTMQGKPVIIRTMDIGGDKRLSYFHLPGEMNPFLGYRALRVSLNEPAVFKTQLRALLRASYYGNVWIMFPMVSCIEEIRRAKFILQQCAEELRQEGTPFNPQLKTGIMVEIPAIALQAEAAANEVDFFSIGTNDLLQYSLAVDRMNHQVAPLYNPYHPGVLFLLKHVFDAARHVGIPAAMCGEMAGDTAMVPLLLGLGLRQFSMSPSAIPEVKALLRHLSVQHCETLASRALSMATGEEVRRLIQDERRPSDTLAF